MKIIKVPYNKKIQSIFDTIILVIGYGGLTLIILSILELDWVLFLIGILVTFPASWFLWKTMTMQILIWTKDFIEIRGIIKIDGRGFSIRFNDNVTRLTFKEIHYFKLDTNNNLVIKPQRGNSITIEKEYFNWYALLKKLPSSKLLDNQIPEFLNKTYKNLTTCKICGKIALSENECLSCRSDSFSKKSKADYLTELEYIKEEQLELFCTDDEFEKVNLFLNEDDGFELDKTWKPIVTEQEVTEFSKKNY